MVQKQWEEERKVGEITIAERNRKEDIVISLRFLQSGSNETLFIIIKHISGRCNCCGRRESVERDVAQAEITKVIG